MLKKVIDICHMEFKFDTFVEVMDYFKDLINIFRQMNFSEYKSEQFYKYDKQLDELLKEKS